MKSKFLMATILAAAASGCGNLSLTQPPQGHLLTGVERTRPAGTIPPPIDYTLAIPRPRRVARAETYSVTVNEVPVHDLLFCA